MAIGPTGHDSPLVLAADDELRESVREWYSNAFGVSIDVVAQGSYSELVVRAAARDANVRLVHAGRGLAHVLPVVVTALTARKAGAGVDVIEHPEAELHPAATLISSRRFSVAPGPWRRHGRSVLVTAHPRTTDELMPGDAFRLADEPLWILVENRISDGSFVERVVKELDESLRTLWKRPGTPIQIDSVGGKGQMPQEVQRRAERVPYRPRFVAVVDSDRKAPGADASLEARRLLRACAKRNLPCWILAKRKPRTTCPESSSVSNKTLAEDHERRIDAWNRLNDGAKELLRYEAWPAGNPLSG